MRKAKKSDFEERSFDFHEGHIHPEEIVVRVWKPKDSEVGHVSLETKDVYVSLWPSSSVEISFINSNYVVNPTLNSLKQDLEQKGFGKTFRLYTLGKINVKRIKELFEHLLIRRIGYSFLNSDWDICRLEKFVQSYKKGLPGSEKFYTNCSGLVYCLLLQGNITELISGTNVTIDSIKNENVGKNQIYWSQVQRGLNQQNFLLNNRLFEGYLGSIYEGKIKSLVTPLDILKLLKISIRKEILEKKCIGPSSGKKYLHALLIHEWKDFYFIQLGNELGAENGNVAKAFRFSRNGKKICKRVKVEWGKIRYGKSYVISYINSRRALEKLESARHSSVIDFDRFFLSLLDESGSCNLSYFLKLISAKDSDCNEFNFESFYAKGKIYFQGEQSFFYDIVHTTKACDNPKYFFRKVIFLETMLRALSLENDNRGFWGFASIIVESKSSIFIDAFEIIFDNLFRRKKNISWISDKHERVAQMTTFYREICSDFFDLELKVNLDSFSRKKIELLNKIKNYSETIRQRFNSNIEKNRYLSLLHEVWNFQIKIIKKRILLHEASLKKFLWRGSTVGKISLAIFLPIIVVHLYQNEIPKASWMALGTIGFLTFTYFLDICNLISLSRSGFNEMEKDYISEKSIFLKNFKQCISARDLKAYEEFLAAESFKEFSLIKKLGLFTSFFRDTETEHNNAIRYGL